MACSRIKQQLHIHRRKGCDQSLRELNCLNLHKSLGRRRKADACKPRLDRDTALIRRYSLQQWLIYMNPQQLLSRSIRSQRLSY
jgi:hypothetical protein